VTELQHLTPTQLSDRRSEQPGNVGTQRRRERRRAREQEVARDDRHDVGPARVHARYAAARVGLVDDVVVVQRAEVDEFARCGSRDHLGVDPVGTRCRIGRAQRQRRARALAARVDEM
jgi:hypothetical protein